MRGWDQAQTTKSACDLTLSQNGHQQLVSRMSTTGLLLRLSESGRVGSVEVGAVAGTCRGQAVDCYQQLTG